MKYKSLRFSLLSIFSMFWGMVFAQEPAVTLDFTSQDNWNIPTSGTNTTLASFTDGTYTIKLCAADNYKLNNGYLIYGKNGSFLELPPFDFDVEKIEVVGRSGASASVKQALTNGNGALLNCAETTGAQGTNTYVLTGDDQKAGTYRILVTSAHNTQITKIHVYKMDASDTRETTTMTLGEYVSTGEVGSTINLPSATVATATGALTGAEVSWESSNTEVATIGNGVINLLTVGTTTIKATYAGDNTYKPCDASYNVTVTPAGVTISSFSELQAKCTSTTATPATITFNGELVVYVNGSNAYLADANGLGAMIYTSNHGLEAGQTLTGTIVAKIQLYQGAAEITGFSKEGLTIGTADVVPAEKTIGDITTAQQSTLVTLKNVTYNASEKIFYDEENSITSYDKFKTNVALEDGKAYDVTGVVILYNQTIEICPRTADDVVEATTTVPEQWTWADIFADFTDQSFFTEADANGATAGLKMNADGGFTRVAADDVTANAIISGKYHSKEHGISNFSATVKVEGTVKISFGTCAWGGDVTVKNAEGETVATMNTNTGACYHQNKENNIVSCYYKQDVATTLTISGGSYVPYFAVEKIDPSQVPTDVKFIFDIANSGAQGVGPAEQLVAIGDEFTIPANFTLYKEGYTLTGWAAEGTIYAPGETITAPDAESLTLTPVFTENRMSLADRDDAVTVKWNFRRDQGAPAVGWEGKAGLVWVAQATVNGKTIDVALPFSTNPGKFNNKNNTDWVQINNGTTFTVPSCKAAVISMEAYSAITSTTIDGQTDYTQGQTISYTVAGAAESVDVVIGDGSYYRYIQVVLPKVEQSQGGGESFDHVAGTINWFVGDEQQPTISNDIAGAISNASVSVGDGLTVAAANYFDTDMVKYTPTTSNSGTVEGVMIEYRVKPAAGVTFQPTQIDYAAVKVGTDNATYSWSYTVDGQESTITKIDPKPDLLRNNGSNSVDNGGTAKLMHTETFNVGECDEFTFRFYISDCANNKNICIGNVTISGIVNGETVSVNMYQLAAVASPAEGGSINVYPVAEQYEEGSEVTLTATENFGYDFVNWTNAAGEEVSTEAKFKYTVTSNETLTANFVAVETYELALTVDGTNDYMVTISPEPTIVEGKMMYEEGTAVQLNANQYEGLVTFTNWNDGDTNSSKIISMTEDVQITAMYAEADIIAGWDFYKRGSEGRKADFAAQDNDGDALILVNTETGETSGWLDKSTEADGGYESFKGAAVNWRTGASNGDVGNWHWQTKINAAAFTDINVQFQMLYNYNAYQTYNAEYSLDGENWTKFGSVTMSSNRVVGTFNEQMPAEANNQAELYIRMIADKTSNVHGAESRNDGNTLAMFFITGTPKLVDDGVAPVLVSTVPENGATGASASGKIVLTFDERVKVADGAKASVAIPMPTGSDEGLKVYQELTPAVSGKVVSFEYKGLEYGAQYDFVLPANSVADLTDNFVKEDICLTFTIMTRPTINKKMYDFVVPDDGTFAQALNAAAARQDKTSRYRIFVKQGSYVIPANQEAPVEGSDGQSYADPKTYFNTPNVSIIGEDPANTSITNEMPNSLASNPDAGANGQANPLEGIRTSGVLYLQSGATDTYFQDIKLWSATADATGRNVVLVDGGNRTICKNVTLWAYQDTYVSDNTQNFYYFEGGLLRGRTDFLCGSGDVFYNGVTLQMCQDGGYIAVPRANVKYGYVFKDCTIKGETSKVDGNYFLGRPWTEAAEVYFIDTKMEALPRAIGWADMSAGGCTRMAEWNSMTATGSAVDLSGRAKQLGKETPNPNNPVLTAEEALEIGNLHNMFGDWDPTLATEQAPIPSNVKLNSDTKTLTWDNSNYALLWAIVKDGKVVDFTIENTYTVDDAYATYAVRAANEMGGLSEAGEALITTAITEVANGEQAMPETIYNLNGIRVDKAQKGLYIINGKKVVIK